MITKKTKRQGMKSIEEPLNNMPLNLWLSAVTNKCITDEDGTGLLATETEVSSIQIKPSDLYNYKVYGFPDWATHIYWCDK